jgi:hypothetical protein
MCGPVWDGGELGSSQINRLWKWHAFIDMEGIVIYEKDVAGWATRLGMEGCFGVVSTVTGLSVYDKERGPKARVAS